jgi:exopolysaccharide biosynthesis polyprenyl glycosylphosphotransferase
VATKAPSEASSREPQEGVRPGAPPPPGSDVRRSRVYLLSRSTVVGVLRRTLSIAALVVVDVAGLALGLYVALVIRQLVYGESDVFWSLLWRQEREWLQFLVPITVLVFLQAGLYAPRERRAGPGRIVASLIVVALIVLAFGLGTDYEFTTTGLIPTATVCAAISIGVLRAAYESISLELMEIAGIRRRVVLVGDGESLARIRRQIDAARGGIAYELVGVVSRDPAPGLRQLGTGLVDLRAVLEREKPDELVLAEASFDERTTLDIVEAAHREGVKVRLAPDTTDLLVHEGRYVPGQGVPLFELRPPMLSGFDWALKRVFDITVSLLLGALLVPLWLLVALAIKLDSRGPVLYVDRRVGVGEREFGMLKFRTMVADASEQQAALEAANEAEGALFKIRDDPRVTRVGAVLRRFSIDELPQLLNVVRGEMSLVGPRPLPLRDFALLEDWHRARYLVLPGMTGLWQISGRSGLSFDDLVRLDFAYLENWSIWLDVSIIAKTIPAVLKGEGAY